MLFVTHTTNDQKIVNFKKNLSTFSLDLHKICGQNVLINYTLNIIMKVIVRNVHYCKSPLISLNNTSTTCQIAVLIPPSQLYFYEYYISFLKVVEYYINII